MINQKQTPSDSPKSSGVNIITQDKDTNFIEILNFIQTELFLLQQKALKKLIKKGGAL